jgi:hypothetical protein
MIGGRFKAGRVDAGSAPPQIRKTLGMASLFHSHLAATPKKPMPSESAQPPEPNPTHPLEKKAENLIG